MQRVPDETRTGVDPTAPLEVPAQPFQPTAPPEVPGQPVELNQSSPPRHMESDLKVHDPVCHMDLAIGEAVAQMDYDGRSYSFCSQECKEEFSRDPEGVLRREAAKVHG